MASLDAGGATVLGFSLADFIIESQRRGKRPARLRPGSQPERSSAPGPGSGLGSKLSEFFGFVGALSEAGARGRSGPLEVADKLTTRIARELAETVRQAVRSEMEKERAERAARTSKEDVAKRRKLRAAPGSGGSQSLRSGTTGGDDDPEPRRISLDDVTGIIDRLNRDRR